MYLHTNNAKYNKYTNVMSNENVLLKEKRSYLFNLWTLYVIKISQVVSYQELILQAVLILLFVIIFQMYILC